MNAGGAGGVRGTKKNVLTYRSYNLPKKHQPRQKEKWQHTPQKEQKRSKANIVVRMRYLRKEIAFLIHRGVPIQATIRAKELIYLSAKLRERTRNPTIRTFKQYFIDFLIHICCLIASRKF